MFWKRKKQNLIYRKRKTRDIDPDEIFLDSSNLPKFDKDQFEGRIEKPISKKVTLALLVFFIFVALFYAGRIGYLQIARGEYYSERSKNNRLESSLVFPERGVITDRNNNELAWNEKSDNNLDFSKRIYTNDEGFSHLLGFVDYPSKDSSGNYYERNMTGKSGVERFFQDILSGRSGRLIKEVDALGEIQAENLIDRTIDGEDLTLSIDKEVQHELYELIRQRTLDSGFVGGAGVIMNVNTGEILAITSYPEFDSNVLTAGEDDKTIDSYNKDVDKPFLNRATSGLYTPGSIVKPFIALAALEEEIISPTKKIESTGSISIPNPYFPDRFSVFNDWKAHGWVDMREALAVSSNVYFYEIGGGYKNQEGLGITKIENLMNKFGFGESPDIDFAETQDGVIPGPKWKEANFEDGVWRLGDTYNTSIGQYGFQVTPLQVARSFALIANGGKLVRPTVIENEGVKIDREIDLKRDNLKVVREGMEMAVQEGTARGLNVPFARLGAKTGTAEVGASKRLVNSWAVGFWPYEKPRYSFAVVMEKGPEANLIGSVWVMRRLLDFLNTKHPEYLQPE